MTCSKCNSPDAKHFEKLNADLCIPCMLVAIKDIPNIAVRNIQLQVSTSLELIENSRSIDAHTLETGDWFNAETVSLEELKSAIMNDTSIEPDKRLYEYHKLVAERIDVLNKTCFDISNAMEVLQHQKHEAWARRNAANENLNGYVQDVRGEIRERIRISDEKYQPPVKATKVKLPPKKIDTFERAVQALSVARGITLTEARLILENGGKEIR